jgi:iron(III) transport system permease protein
MSSEVQNAAPAFVAPVRLKRQRWSLGTFVCFGLMLVLAAFVIYPVFLLIRDAFVVTGPGGVETTGVRNWIEVWSEPGLVRSVVNTFNRAAVTTVVSLPIAILLAWLATRTDLPGKRLIIICAWVAFFMPTLPVVLGWILLLDPQYGLLNTLMMDLFGLTAGPFNIYSFWGIIFAHLMTKAIAIKFIFLVPAFRNISSALEEASCISGASRFYTIRHIVVPVLAPAIVITTVISLINSLESFEIELVLGTSWNFHVFSTKIYQLMRDDPPAIGMATVLGVSVLLSMLPLIGFQRWFSARRNYATLNSAFKSDPARLQGARWPIFAGVAVFALCLTVVPMVFLVLGTFMKAFGYFNLPQPYTLKHWQLVLHDSQFIGATLNTLKLGLGASLIGCCLGAAIAYVCVRTKFRYRAVIDVLTWLPASIPGIILGLGLLSMFLRVPIFTPLYGTVGVLIVAVLFASLTTGVQLIKSNLVQLGADLEEASALTGGSWFYTFRRVVLPLVGGVLVTVAILTFASATRNIANIAMLVTNENQPLAMLQLGFMADGIFESAAIVGVITTLISCGVAALAFLVGKRIGLRI